MHDGKATHAPLLVRCTMPRAMPTLLLSPRMRITPGYLSCRNREKEKGDGEGACEYTTYTD